MKDLANWQNARKSQYAESWYSYWWIFHFYRNKFNDGSVQWCVLLGITKRYSLMLSFKRKES